MFDSGAADYTVRFIQYLRHVDGKWHGRPFTLLPWQREAVETFYGTLTDKNTRQYQYLYLEIPKKNGKSELAAALGLYHTFMDLEMRGEVYLCAADRANAGIVFNVALGMVEQCPSLGKRCVIRASTRELMDKRTGTVMKVMSSEAFSKHGYKPSCVIFDELHAQRNRELWDVMTFGAGDARHQPVWIVLTTAGDDPDRSSIGWEVHGKARSILGYRAGDRENNVDDPRWLPYLYGMPDDPEECAALDIQEEALWFRCNPSLGITVPLETVRAEAEEAKHNPARERLFRWLRLNQWIAVKTVGWLPLTLFDQTAQEIPPEHLGGLRCYGGLDLSATTDLTAFVLLFPPQKGLKRWYALFRAWIPLDKLREREQRDHQDFSGWMRRKDLIATQGDSVDYDLVEQAILEAARTYRLELVGVDRWHSLMITQHLMATGQEVADIPQDMANLSPAMKTMEWLLRRGEMTHPANACARWCFGNVRCAVDGNENLKPMKNRSIGRIDVTMAWIIAMAAAMLREGNDVGELCYSPDL